jgi:hypothetical protein
MTTLVLAAALSLGGTEANASSSATLQQAQPRPAAIELAGVFDNRRGRRLFPFRRATGSPVMSAPSATPSSTPEPHLAPPKPAEADKVT